MVLVTMLRGVNVGGHNKVRMAELKALYESLGFADVETYVQSGNVAFRARAGARAGIGARIEEAISRRFGFRPAVVARTAAELRSVVARNPFASREGIEPAKLLVHFLEREPEAAARGKLQSLPPAPEEWRLDGRELYVYFPNGQARPKLSMAQVDRALAVPGTGRNWNTVLRLLEMAERLEQGQSR
jgi:uncharacterized protein (DUF1697 family)